MQQTLQFDCPTTSRKKSAHSATRNFTVLSWRPIWNHRERNLGSRCDDIIAASTREVAIELAFAHRYCTTETIPASQIKLIEHDTSHRWRYYIAFLPSGPAIGTGVLLKIRSSKAVSRKVLWNDIVRQYLPARPAWIEPTRVTR